MTESGSSQPAATALNIVVRKQFRFSAEQVFAAWLNRNTVGNWLFATPAGIMKHVDLDPVKGGRFRIEEQRGAVLAKHFGQFLEILPSHRIVFTFSTDPAHAGTPVTIEIASQPGRCELTLVHELAMEWRSSADRIRDGWDHILGGLDRFLASTAETHRSGQDLLIVRDFPFSRHHVFSGWSSAESLLSWWTPQGTSLSVEQFEFRPDGVWKFSLSRPQGSSDPHEIHFREISTQERIVLHQVSSPRFLASATFEEIPLGTRLYFSTRFESPEALEQHLFLTTRENEEKFDRLTELLTLRHLGQLSGVT